MANIPKIYLCILLCANTNWKTCIKLLSVSPYNSLYFLNVLQCIYVPFMFITEKINTRRIRGSQGRICSPNKPFYFQPKANFTCILICITGVCVCAQSCPTFCDPMDCSPPGSSVHGIFQASIVEWVAISFFRGSSLPRDWTCVSCVSCIAGWFFTTEPPVASLRMTETSTKSSKVPISLIEMMKSVWRPSRTVNIYIFKKTSSHNSLKLIHLS